MVGVWQTSSDTSFGVRYRQAGSYAARVTWSVPYRYMLATPPTTTNTDRTLCCARLSVCVNRQSVGDRLVALPYTCCVVHCALYAVRCTHHVHTIGIGIGSPE